MVSEYTIEISNGLSFPLNEIDEVDEKQLGPDVQSQISEMPSVSGPKTAEYGGQEPWTHQWYGTLQVNEMVHFRIPDDDSFENRVRKIVSSLLEFFGNSETPTGATVDDFQWRVQVNKDSSSIRPEGTHSILISWEPISHEN